MKMLQSLCYFIFTLVIPAFETFCENLTDIYEKLKQIQTGKADPFLTKLDHLDDEKFGIAVCTVDGQRFSIGKYYVSIWRVCFSSHELIYLRR